MSEVIVWTNCQPDLKDIAAQGVVYLQLIANNKTETEIRQKVINTMTNTNHPETFRSINNRAGFIWKVGFL